MSDEELQALAEEQAALRRVATLVARGAAPEEVFAVVTEEVGQLLPVEFAAMGRFEADATVTSIATWGAAVVASFPVGSRWGLQGTNLATIVLDTGRSARVDGFARASGPIGVASREAGFRSAVATPIIVEGRAWGLTCVGTTSLDTLLPAETEVRLASFTELVATAIANAESRAGLARLAGEQTALRRVATLVAEGVPPEELFAAVANEAARLFLVDVVTIGRYEHDGTYTVVASVGERLPVGGRWPLGGNNGATLVFQTGRPARIDSYATASGAGGVATYEAGVRSSVAAPILVEGTLWGVICVGTTLERQLPADTEARLTSLTELVAMAIANAERRRALAASRARLVTAADEARRRIGRDLHDRAQQKLVSLMLELRAGEAAEPSKVAELRRQVTRTGQRLAGALKELQELSRGIHPAVLSQGGLRPALAALKRRSAVPVELEVRAERRAPEPVEVAVYYVVTEALANAAEYAGSSVVKVELDICDATLELAIRGDGIGGAELSQGSSLVGLCDRVEALGGTLQLTSPPGGGTELMVEIPLDGDGDEVSAGRGVSTSLPAGPTMPASPPPPSKKAALPADARSRSAEHDQPHGGGGDELPVLVEEQAALRRVATLVARGAAPEEVFAAVTEEVGELFRFQSAGMGRYDPDGVITFVAVWGRLVDFFPVGSRLSLRGQHIAARVFETGGPVRVQRSADSTDPVSVFAREAGVRQSVGAPILVDGRLWGVIGAGSTAEHPLPAETEARLASFTELSATAIANAESRARLSRLANEQAALRRVATLVARGVPPSEVFAAVAEEVGLLLGVDHTGMSRYEPDGTSTTLAIWSRTGEPVAPVGSRWSYAGNNLSRMVFETGRPARLDSYDDATGPLGDTLRKRGIRSSVATPITVDGHLWGMMAAGLGLEQPLPADTEARLSDFTELVATAIANAETRAALAASRTRIVAAADETRHRIERNLHDGAQQRLVNLMLELRLTETAPASDAGALRAQLARTAGGLAEVLEELQEIAQGIHPPILSNEGLERALRALTGRSAVPVELDFRLERRLPEHVEVGAYYVVSEALTNVAKHAHASAVHIELDDTPVASSRLVIRDDGIGGADPEKGSGLVGVSDRIEALGGTLEVTSPPGRGTTLVIEIPLECPSRGDPTAVVVSRLPSPSQPSVRVAPPHARDAH